MTYIPLLRNDLEIFGQNAYNKLCPQWLEERLNQLTNDELRAVLGMKNSQLERGHLMAEGMIRFYYKPYSPLVQDQWSDERIETDKNWLTDDELEFLRGFMSWTAARGYTQRPRFFSRDVLTI
jgi:hypothetical protein